MTTVRYRCVAEFPTNGNAPRFGGYSILITEDENGAPVHGLPVFSVIEHDPARRDRQSRVVAGFDTIGEALSLALRNQGFGDPIADAYTAGRQDGNATAAELARSIVDGYNARTA